MLDNNRQSIVEFDYNKLGQQVNKTDNITLESIITSFIYVNKLSSRSEASEGSYWVRAVFYNKSGWLIESVMASNHNATDYCPENQSIASELDKLSSKDVKCFYSEHNQYDDWINGYCVSGKGITK